MVRSTNQKRALPALPPRPKRSAPERVGQHLLPAQALLLHAARTLNKLPPVDGGLRGRRLRLGVVDAGRLLLAGHAQHGDGAQVQAPLRLAAAAAAAAAWGGRLVELLLTLREHVQERCVLLLLRLRCAPLLMQAPRAIKLKLRCCCGSDMGRWRSSSGKHRCCCCSCRCCRGRMHLLLSPTGCRCAYRCSQCPCAALRGLATAHRGVAGRRAPIRCVKGSHTPHQPSF